VASEAQVRPIQEAMDSAMSRGVIEVQHIRYFEEAQLGSQGKEITRLLDKVSKQLDETTQLLSKE
jgi:hypothetical protein